MLFRGMKFGWSVMLVLLSLMLAGCPHGIMPYNQPDTDLYIRVVDGQGKDMLDPATSGFFTYSNIRVYYVIDGVKTPYNQTSNQRPGSGGFGIEKGYWSSDPYFIMNISSNDVIKGNEATTLLEFVGKQTDTIRCVFHNTTKKGDPRRDSVYLNSVFMQGAFKDQIETFDIIIK